MMVRSMAILFLAAAAAQAGESKTKGPDEAMVKAISLVKKQVEEWKGEGYKAQAINDKFVRETFPNHVFVAVHFPLWPVARAAPEPMMSQNLFAVSKEGKVTHLADAENKLAGFFAATLDKKRDQTAVAKSWLVLRMEYIQDGYYKFKQPGKITPLNDLAMGDIEVVPEMGNSGSVKVVIRFSESQRFTVVSEELKVMRGMRPRCQATLLLHSEKLVREIAEQDLLVMGRHARGYLMEQRAKASVELRREIDRVWRQIEIEGR